MVITILISIKTLKLDIFLNFELIYFSCIFELKSELPEYRVHVNLVPLTRNYMKTTYVQHISSKYNLKVIIPYTII